VANEAGWNPDVIERQLAHVERNQVRAAYNRSAYLPDRTKLLQWWADYIEARKADKVVVTLHAAPSGKTVKYVLQASDGSDGRK